MAELALLKHARATMDATDVALREVEVIAFNRLRATVERMLEHLEQQHAAASGPAGDVDAGRLCQRCELPASYAVHTDTDGILSHEFVPPEQLVSAAEAQAIDVRVKQHFERAQQQTSAMAAKLDAEARIRALRHARGEEGCGSFTAGVPDIADALDLDALQRLCDAATADEWEFDEAELVVRTVHGPIVCDVDCGSRECDVADGRFIATARDALPKLIAEVRRLRGEVRELEGYRTAMEGEFANEEVSIERVDDSEAEHG